MKCVETDDYWYLMCPDESPGLADCHGDEFETLYLKYQVDGQFREKVKARDIWQKIIDSQIETGTPYILYKDAVNKKSNQQNLGTIKSSNLCAEITEYTDKNETACCNLASIALSKFVISPIIPYDPITIYTKSGCNYCKLAKMLLTNHGINFTICSLDDDKVRADFFEKINEPHTVPQIYVGDERIGGYDKLFDMLKPTYDFEKLRQISRIITRNLDKIINVNFYPIPELLCQVYRLFHRTIIDGFKYF